MGTLETLPDRAPTRRADPETSGEAAGTLRNLTARHRAVWETLRSMGPAADFEIERWYDACRLNEWWVPQTPQSLRSRRKVLTEYGLVVTDGRRKKSPNGGHSALVWAAVDPGRASQLFGAAR